MRKNNNTRMALASIGSAKWRSFLTMLGVIIGVMSVVTIVSLGEGVKQQLANQTKLSGSDLLTVRGGTIASRDTSGKITNVNTLNLFSGINLSDADYGVVQKVAGAEQVAPFAIVTGVPAVGENKDATASVVATNFKGAAALNQDIEYGAFFEEHDKNHPVAIIGKRVAEQLFKENVPIGKSFQFRGQQLTVRGVFKEFEATPLGLGVDYNHAIFIPYDYAKQLAGVVLQPYQILARPASGTTSAALATAITTDLAKAHGGQTDFTVLQAGDTLAVANNVLTMLTNLVSAVAAISLLVGGIGIMNIMLVAVSERTYEIGIRKSIGATNRQILTQFMTEATVLSGLGGVFGVLASLLVNYFLRVFTSLQPVITLPIMGIAVLVALAVGVLSGATPALKAAHKDPIEALRRT